MAPVIVPTEPEAEQSPVPEVPEQPAQTETAPESPEIPEEPVTEETHSEKTETEEPAPEETLPEDTQQLTAVGTIIIQGSNAMDIPTATESVILRYAEAINHLQENMGDDIKKFYTGISYRHCLIWKNGNDKYDFTRPHDILGKRIGEYLPKIENGGEEFLDLMKKSYDIL
jgi:hypothetical protein